MAVHADQGDAPQGAVCLPVAAAVQAVPVGAARGNRDGRGAAQAGEGAFGAQPGGVVSGGDEQLPGGIDADARQGDQVRRGCGDQRDELERLGRRSRPAALASGGPATAGRPWSRPLGQSKNRAGTRRRRGHADGRSASAAGREPARARRR